jgi:hypothetical protein
MMRSPLNLARLVAQDDPLRRGCTRLLIGWFAVASASVAALAVTAMLLASGPSVSATAAPWLRQFAGGGTAKPGFGLVISWVSQHLHHSPAQTVAFLQLATATLLLFGAGRLALELRGVWTALATVTVLLVWPAGRQAVTTFSAESLLGLSGVAVALGGVWLQERPQRGALVVAFGLALAALVHPLGLVTAPALGLAVLVWPRPACQSDAADPTAADSGLAVRRIRLAWLTALVLAGAFVLVILPKGGMKSLWNESLGALRAYSPSPRIGLAGWPYVGPVVAVAGQLPIVLLGLAAGGTTRALAAGRTAWALSAGLLAVWVGALAVAGTPAVPNGLDAVVVLAPLIVVVGAVQGSDVFVALVVWSRGRRRGGMVAFVILATVAAILADTSLGLEDRRNALAWFPGVLRSTEPLRPAVLTPSDASLLAGHRLTVTLLPARPGGAALGEVVGAVFPKLANLAVSPTNAAVTALVPAHSSHPIDRALRMAGTRLQCAADGRSCLYRLKGNR